MVSRKGKHVSCFIQTGQKTCHDVKGRKITCAGSGQDAESAMGMPWPTPRFETVGTTAVDLLTGLSWLPDANPAELPLDWRAALDFIDELNRGRAHGFGDWRLPNRHELRSLISHETKNPALPEAHPFANVFPGWYWTSTTAAINSDFAWYVHMGGGRSFYGAKSQFYLLWPVRGEGNKAVECKWPVPRFEVEDDGDSVIDHMTKLHWQRSADLTGEPVVWEDALKSVKELNERHAAGRQWRLPNINELESLVDLSRHDPALSPGHPFGTIQEVYWSSTTSMFEPDWAWALYAFKGALGVGIKGYARFHVWTVSDGDL